MVKRLARSANTAFLRPALPVVPGWSPAAPAGKRPTCFYRRDTEAGGRGPGDSRAGSSQALAHAAHDSPGTAVAPVAGPPVLAGSADAPLCQGAAGARAPPDEVAQRVSRPPPGRCPLWPPLQPSQWLPQPLWSSLSPARVAASERSEWPSGPP